MQRLARALRVAAWVAVATLIASVLVHWFVHRLSLADVCAVAALPWIVAFAWTVSRRITRAQCAAWADKHLGGASAYATWLEAADDTHAGSTRLAVERLAQWVDEAVPRSVAMLQARPLRMRLARPLVAALVCAALTAVLVQIPARHEATTTAEFIPGTAVPRTGADADARSARGDRLADDAPEATTAGQPVAPAARPAGPETSPQQGTTRQNETDAGTTQDGLPLAAAPGAGTAGSRAGSGGHQAGDSPDTSPDTGLSESWQGALAEKLRASQAATASETARADPERSAAYDAALGLPDTSSAAARMAPAPAVAPEARTAVRLGPAEQAYVRAYFAGSGAGP